MDHTWILTPVSSLIFVITNRSGHHNMFVYEDYASITPMTPPKSTLFWDFLFKGRESASTQGQFSHQASS